MSGSEKLATCKIDYDVEFGADRLAVFPGGLECVALHRSDGTLLEFFLVYGKVNFFDHGPGGMNVACSSVRLDIAVHYYQTA